MGGSGVRVVGVGTETGEHSDLGASLFSPLVMGVVVVVVIVIVVVVVIVIVVVFILLLCCARVCQCSGHYLCNAK